MTVRDHLEDICPKCRQDKLVVIEAVVDPLIPEGSFWLIECSNCGHIEERDELEDHAEHS